MHSQQQSAHIRLEHALQHASESEAVFEVFGRE